jgi:ribosomal protein S18 acetylase RimI-like enzyme
MAFVENVVIRKLRVEDAEEVRRIQLAITKRADDIDYRQSIKTVLSGDRNVALAAEVNGVVAGYMVSHTLLGGFGLAKSAWITDFGVDPKLMGQGIGKSLAQKVLEEHESLGITQVYTAVRWDSVDILSFFRTLGFDRSVFINLCKNEERP